LISQKNGGFRKKIAQSKNGRPKACLYLLSFYIN
jgi:hypothetical protein